MRPTSLPREAIRVVPPRRSPWLSPGAIRVAPRTESRVGLGDSSSDQPSQADIDQAKAWLSQKGSLSTKDYVQLVVSPTSSPQASDAACNDVGIKSNLCSKYGGFAFNAAYGFLGSAISSIWEAIACEAHTNPYWCAKLPYNNRGVNPNGDNLCDLPFPEEYLNGGARTILPDEIIALADDTAVTIANQGLPQCLNNDSFKGGWPGALKTMILIESVAKVQSGEWKSRSQLDRFKKAVSIVQSQGGPGVPFNPLPSTMCPGPVGPEPCAPVPFHGSAASSGSGGGALILVGLGAAALYALSKRSPGKKR